MAEVITTTEPTVSSCCPPEAQTTCCEPGAKAKCCDPNHDEGCECFAGQGAEAIVLASKPAEQPA